MIRRPGRRDRGDDLPLLHRPRRRGARLLDALAAYVLAQLVMSCLVWRMFESEVDRRDGLAAVVVFVPVLLAVLRYVLSGRRISAGPLFVGGRVCTNCGYDLRATPERCPECGRVVPGAHGPDA
jgi:uncharacterized RDD family membrane protein YckC